MSKTNSNLKTSLNSSLEQLQQIMVQLRNPGTGCPWDIKQSYESIVPYTIEEVYEVVDAIEKRDFNELKNELGDLLFQVVFYSQMASEDQYFDLTEVIDGICEKLTRRHPHVFANKSYDNEGQVHRAWEDLKQQEREDKSVNQSASLLDDIPAVLPELKRAQKIQNRVSQQGFDWTNVDQVWEKLDEEACEIKDAVKSDDQSHIEEEVGDLLFVCVNLARHYNVDADTALRKANKKFESRFRQIEGLADKPISEYSADQLEVFWQQAKKQERNK
ncbi:MAG: nucleoside triphosphate pyrophosphohydrolase [Kangiellaceae bacterium]|nr:nucleoside triphosphate pyrophosphohydrolase [Kangiellaceae bacterium]